MKRTWFTVFMCLAMASGGMPRMTSAQTPPTTSCPLADCEPYCDYGPATRHTLPSEQADHSRSHESGSRTVGSPHDDGRGGHFWDGYADYLKGLYPYDYYDDTAELSHSPLNAATNDDELAAWHAPYALHGPNPDFADSDELEFDSQPSPFYGIESSVAQQANGEYSPLYGIEEANQWADARDDSEDVAYGYECQELSHDLKPEGDATSHDDIALSDESLTDGPAEIESEDDYASYDDNSVPYEGDDEYWDHGYWEGVSYDSDAPAESDADLAHREYQEHGYEDEYNYADNYEYEYDYDNYEYWYGDDNNSPPVQTANSSLSDSDDMGGDQALTYDAEFYQRYEAEVRPVYSEEHEPPLEAMPETSSPADPYEGYEGYDYGDYGYEDSETVEADAQSRGDDSELEHEDYGPEYGYEYEYGNAYDAAGIDPSLPSSVDGSREWNSGIDDLYASEADASGDTQAPADSWFNDEAWNNALEPMPSSNAASPADAETLNWGEGDFYEVHDAQMPVDYESQWDGTATPSPQPSLTDTADLYEESWFEHNDQDYESDYEPSNDYSTSSASDATAPARPNTTNSEPDYWEEYSDYVEPSVNRGAALDHGQYWYGDEGDWEVWESAPSDSSDSSDPSDPSDPSDSSDSSDSQFIPADSPLPESYWPEEYQPYDLETASGSETTSGSASAQSAPYMLPYAARITIAPLWWATGSLAEHCWKPLTQATENLQEFWGATSDGLQAQLLPPLEVVPNASDEWNCDRAWEAARSEEVIWDN